MPTSLQIDNQGNLKHLLTIEGLSKEQILDILDVSDEFMDENRHPIKKTVLQNLSIFNLFFEPSTRTRTTFEIAEKNLGARIINLNLEASATKKGETLLDTIHNLEAMGANMFVIRHNASGAANFFAQHVDSNVAVINAGDGCHAHPTQALLDMATIRQHKKRFEHLKVAIVGDIRHSRVARSQIHALNILEVEEVRVIAPKTLIPPGVEQLGVQVHHELKEGIRDADVVIGLRLQKERMESAFFPSEREFYYRYGLTNDVLKYADKSAIVMHPGPVNRGIEMAFSLIDGPASVILHQVTEGIAVRMAIMKIIAKNRWGTS